MSYAVGGVSLIERIAPGDQKAHVFCHEGNKFCHDPLAIRTTEAGRRQHKEAHVDFFVDSLETETYILTEKAMDCIHENLAAERGVL